MAVIRITSVHNDKLVIGALYGKVLPSTTSQALQDVMPATAE